MAFTSKVIHNPITGQQIKFIKTSRDTNGSMLEMESTFSKFSNEPPPHYHPHQEEEFKIIKGSISVRINGEVKILHQGDRLYIPRNTVHSMWNHSNDTSIVNWRVSPALNTEYLLETVMGLASIGKVNKSGMPSILQMALVANKYGKEYRLARPSFAIQKALFTILTPLAYFVGYRSSYKCFIN